MGNTVVLKPATYTRLSALLIAEICIEAGLPPGTVGMHPLSMCLVNLSESLIFVVGLGNYITYSSGQYCICCAVVVRSVIEYMTSLCHE